MPRFEINFLDDYTDESLLAEIRRVAANYSGQFLSMQTFDRLSGRVSCSAIRHRFGGWKEALTKAGLGRLYGGRTVSEKMKAQAHRRLSNDDLIAEMKRVYAQIGRAELTTVDFDHHSAITSSVAARSRFGSWKNALKTAGIPQSRGATKGWTEEACFENIAAVWAQLGRQPMYKEMFAPPSTINGKAYEYRWGTWRKSLRAFVVWASGDGKEDYSESRPELPSAESLPKSSVIQRAEEDRRTVGPRLRFRVLQRDRFKCVACGRSPATHLNVVLHADHIHPVALDGKTVFENLQTLCESCNLGKGKMPG